MLGSAWLVPLARIRYGFGSHIRIILISQGTNSESVDVNRVGIEMDYIQQITPQFKLFGNLAWIRAENITGHGNGPVPLPRPRR